MLPYDAVFVVFSGKPKSVSHHVEEARGGARLLTLNSPWTVQFDEQWGAPREVVFPKLMSYTDSDDPGIRYYSGTAVYRTTFNLRNQGGAKAFLDLGRVACMAQVFLNGHDLGVLWKEPYRVDVTDALIDGENQLEVRVVNQWVNRIIGDEQPDCQRRYTHTPTKFYRADSPLLPAGLLGPVSIVTLAEP